MRRIPGVVPRLVLSVVLVLSFAIACGGYGQSPGQTAPPGATGTARPYDGY